MLKPRCCTNLLLPALLGMLLLSGCLSPASEPPAPVNLVDPFIGTSSSTTESARMHSEAANEARGQTFPAVGRPFAMTNWTPQTRDRETKCVSPYYYQDDRMQGFRGSHWMSGSCTQDYGSVTLMPVAGPLRVTPQDRASAFTHETETATPAYYAVELDDYQVSAEMTATARAGFLQFTFHASDSAYVVLNPNSDEGEGYVEILPEQNAVVGYNPAHRIYQGWGEPAGFSGYFYAVFEQPIAGYGTWHGETVYPGEKTRQGQGDTLGVGAYARFDVAPGERVRVKVGTSFTSIEKARQNLEAELSGWDFAAARAGTEAAWNDMLGRVAVRGGSREEQVMFYSALYHTMLLPRIFSDVDGSYPGFAGDKTVRTARGYLYYEDFTAWDTYRAVHPLYTLMAPERARDMVRSLVAKAGEGGWLPIFPCWNNYTAAMIGDHVTAIIGDAFMKGIRDFDVEKAYAAMRKNAMETPGYEEYVDGKGRRALEAYLRHGFIPMEEPVKEAFHQQEQVSRTLEYAYDDFVLAQVARVLGREDDYETLIRRAAFYKNVFDPSVGFVRGRHADGTWAASFAADKRQPYITEGTPWQYTWYVPHDVAGLVDLMGGRERFVAKLDTLFEQRYYWHGNEPNHQIAFLYNYAGAPWKTQQRVREIMKEEYGSGPGGLSGNDDAGQMSAWYAFSAMGLYPVAPGLPYYALTSPLFEEVTFNLPSGRRFTVRAEGASDTNRFIQTATLNGEPYDRPWIEHAAIVEGGTLVYEMGPEPNEAWGSAPEHAPPSMQDARGILQAAETR